MKRILLSVLATVAIVGCSSKETTQVSDTAMPAQASAYDSAASAPVEEAPAPKTKKGKKAYRMSDYEK